MSRKLLINIHLYLASFMAPILIMIAVSGGLYLMGFKGSVESSSVYKGTLEEFNQNAEDLESEVTRLLSANN
ncbi:MAG: PepSY domain-containing protein, partial [Kangiellaceae bacterium]|nr:PepSY domain-containing protein [Kangiellaceae bacterium]